MRHALMYHVLQKAFTTKCDRTILPRLYSQVKNACKNHIKYKWSCTNNAQRTITFAPVHTYFVKIALIAVLPSKMNKLKIEKLWTISEIWFSIFFRTEHDLNTMKNYFPWHEDALDVINRLMDCIVANFWTLIWNKIYFTFNAKHYSYTTHMRNFCWAEKPREWASSQASLVFHVCRPI